MKFFWSMVGFVILIIAAFYLGYKTDLGPVDDDLGAEQYGFGKQEEQPVGGIRTSGGLSNSSSSFGAPKRQVGGVSTNNCLQGARC